VSLKFKALPLLLAIPQSTPEGLRNSAAIISNGVIQAIYHKHLLPNYSVFDEKRYFRAGAEPTV
jgi:NAD+ synthase (glutamine-hydrolysing)